MRLLAPLLLAAVTVAGCGAPPDLASRGDKVPIPSPAPSSAPGIPPGYTPPPPTPSRSASPSPSVSPFPEYTTAACGAKPTAAQVIDLVKSETSIRPDKALTGPLCATSYSAGTWHFTVLQVPGGDPVEVITKDALKLVVAGTDVCTAEVKLRAPSGIKTAAGC